MPPRPVACVFWFTMLCMGQVFADTCTVNICQQKSGGFYAFLTDTSQGCLNSAESALVNACGLNYSGAMCYVDCGSIYSWSSGAYWNAMQCSLLGNPCGSQGQCPASVADVCKMASPATTTASGLSPPATSPSADSQSPSPTFSGPPPATSSSANSRSPSPTFSGPPPTSTSQTSNPPDQTLLSSCAPCGSSKCSFTNSSDLPDATFNLTIGSPAENCQGGNTTITSKVGGTLTIEDMWSVGGTATVNLDIIQIGINPSGSQTHSIMWTQSITIDVLPGQKGVVVASVNYTRSSGAMTVAGKYTSSPQQFPLISNRPINVIAIGVEVIPCASQFNAIDSSAHHCQSSGTGLGGKTVPTPFLTLMMVTLAFLMYFF